MTVKDTVYALYVTLMYSFSVFSYGILMWGNSYLMIMITIKSKKINNYFNKCLVSKEEVLCSIHEFLCPSILQSVETYLKQHFLLCRLTKTTPKYGIK